MYVLAWANTSSQLSYVGEGKPQLSRQLRFLAGCVVVHGPQGLCMVVAPCSVFCLERPTPTTWQVSGGGPPPHFDKSWECAQRPRGVTCSMKT